MAGAGVIGGQTSGYDPANPYVNVNVGVFHNVPVEVNENTKGIATYYLPDGMSPWAPAVIVMTPDHTTAKEFSNSITGLQWPTRIRSAWLLWSRKTAAPGTSLWTLPAGTMQPCWMACIS